jgi:short-subunit dehydrogenase
MAEMDNARAPTCKFAPRSLAGTDVLLIGGSGGIGSALVSALMTAGVNTVIVAAHQPGADALPNVQSEFVDVSDIDSVQALAARLRGRRLSAVINCAGVNSNSALFTPGDCLRARREMEVNYFGLLHVGLVFGPLLAAHAGGTLMTVLSFLSFVNLPALATYSASKAAAHSLNQALRAELRADGVRVCGVYPTAVDTRMSAEQQGAKMSPQDLALAMVDCLQSDFEDLFPGDAAQAHAAWLRDPAGFQQAMAVPAC